MIFIVLSRFFFGQIVKKMDYQEPDKFEKVGLILHPLIILVASISLLLPKA